MVIGDAIAPLVIVWDSCLLILPDTSGGYLFISVAFSTVIILYHMVLNLSIVLTKIFVYFFNFFIRSGCRISDCVIFAELVIAG